MSTLTTPKRVRITRTRDADGKTWRDLNPDAVIVDRRTVFGNPFRVYRCDCCGHWDVIDDNGVSHHVDHAAARGEKATMGIVLDPGPSPSDELQHRAAIVHAVDLFEQDIEWGSAAFTADQVRTELAGKDLACWCEPDAPCHADVLLRVANGATR
ncbi:DUF4326 domain-containing protein [Glycomyces sp. NPDC048151]|uniref:DUF4326 domain-containing protein n=1 Tax=Glycomyces sp. NPDC048151 TaxID=3364002 RepID=UPI003715AFBE